MGLDWKSIEAEARALLAGLDGLALDRAQIERTAERLATGDLDAAVNRFASDPEPVGPEDVDLAEALSNPERARLEALGREALAGGRVAVCVLNGGMATRFGGGVKGVVEALAGRSFLEIKRAQARARGPVPFLVMNSVATHRPTLEFLEARGLAEGVHSFLQSVSLRLTPWGEAFRDDRGQLSLYAPGHGDFPGALRASGLLRELAAVEWILLSNVDNLGAEPDPLVIGYHIAHGRPLTCEIARVARGDVGGTPARADGRIQVVEGFRFSPGFDFSRLHFLATNTFVFSRSALEPVFPLSWFYVEKEVDGRPAVQMERLVNELSRFVDTAYLATPRGGPHGRFFPIKARRELEQLRADPALVERFGSV